MPDSDYITAAELARRWGVSPQRISILIEQGRIKQRSASYARRIRRDVKRPDAIPPGRKPGRGK